MRFNRRSDAVCVTACLLAVPFLVCASSADDAVHGMQPSGTVQPEDVPDHIGREPALAHIAVDMLLAHDRSIESLSWRQTIEVAMTPSLSAVLLRGGPAVPNERADEPRLGFRALLSEPADVSAARVAAKWNEISFDRRNRALIRGRRQLIEAWRRSEDGGLSPVLLAPESWESLEDGGVSTWAVLSENGEIVRALRGVDWESIRGIETPIRALGRMLDLRGLRLGEVLRTAPDLHADQRMNERGETLITLRGTANFGGPWGCFAVVVNASRGGRPERIEVHNPFTGALIWRIVVEDYQDVDGVWIPTRVMFGSYDLAKGPTGAPVDRAFYAGSNEAIERKVRILLNIPEGSTLPIDLSDGSVREAFAEALRSTFGPDGPYCRAVVVHWMEVSEVIALNDCNRIEARINAWHIPDGVEVRDATSTPMWESAPVGVQAVTPVRPAPEGDQ